ncbi:hypothetical protein AB9B48_16850 [Kluyvera ascorbata]|uniref:hypothetical protein n=1 Tax=Kluyvera ascorbata TaxID=51288 RepID=UPI00350E8EE1
MRIAISILMCFFLTPLAIAQNLAQWKYPNGIAMLTPLNISGGSPELALAVTNPNDFNISIIDLRNESNPESSCFIDVKNKSPEIRSMPPAKINGKYVKMISVCIETGGIMSPKTDVGKEYLRDLVLSGVPIEIYLTDKTHFSFPASDIETMKNKVTELNSAM